MNNQEKKKSSISVAIGYGAELVLVILAGVYAGQWIGQHWNQEMLGSVLGCFIAFTLWTWKVIKAEQSATLKKK